MSALKAKDIDRLVKHLESEGARLQRTTKGYRVLGDNGQTVGFHLTASDTRATQNLRADLKRLGHSWPWDPQRPKKREAVSAEQEVTYASYVTETKRPTDRTIAAVRGALMRLNRDVVTAQEVHRECGVSDLVTVIRTMYWLGWRYSGFVGDTGYAKRTRHWKLDPEHDRAAREVLPLQVLVTHTADKPPIVKPKKVKVTPPAPEVPPKGEIISMFVGPAQPEPQVVRLEPSVKGEREVLDTYDSWAVPITDHISTKTVEEVMETLKAFGLQGEIRVWHEA